MPSKRKPVGLDENAKGLGSQDKEHCRRGEKSLCMRNVPVVFRFSKRGVPQQWLLLEDVHDF